MEDKKFLKLKKEATDRLKEGTVEELIISLHENYSNYREINFEIQKLYAEKQKNQKKIQDIKASNDLTTKDLAKINTLNKAISKIDTDITKKEEEYKAKEPEFVTAQELIGKIFKITFRVSEITSVLALVVKLNRVELSFLDSKVKDVLNYKPRVAN